MEAKNALLKMRAWIEAEEERAKKPYQEPFVLLSLTYCAVKAAGADAEAALCHLRRISSLLGAQSHDVLKPDEALFRIDAACSSLDSK